MKKGMAISFFIICFLLGTAYGTYGNSSSQSQASVDSTLTQHINEYERLLSQGEQIQTSYSELISEGVVPKAPISQNQGVAHNNISRLGQDAAGLLKTTVREILRLIVRACDQLITE